MSTPQTPQTATANTDTAPFWKNPFLWAALIGMVALPLMRPFLRRVPKPPPVINALPAFSLVDHNGKKFTLETMKGKVYVVDLFFTRCRSICLQLTHYMKRLQDRLDRAKSPVRLLSITVDPGFDTPDKLKAYGQKYKINFRRWSMVTGPKAIVHKLVKKGFLTALGPKKKDAGVFDIAHSGKLILVDQEGKVRGYYKASPMGVDEVFHRAKHVLKQGRSR